VITGPKNGYDILDIEGIGLVWLQANPLPVTRYSATPRGFHYFFRAVEGLSGSNDLRIHKDIHVRATGSYHCWWPRQGYEVVDAPLADWPEGLLKLALGPQHTSPSSSSHIERALPTCHDQILSASDTINKLNPIAFREYDKWLRLMMACHSGGITQEEFVAWSTSDPLYSDAEDDICRIWDALKVEGNKTGRVGVGTLFAALKQQPVRCVDVPKHRRKMSHADVDELNRMCRWLAHQKNDEGALFWTACRFGNWRMEYVCEDHVLERLLVRAAWEAGLRNKSRVLRQIRNGITAGSVEWLSKHGAADVANTSDGLSLSAMVKPNDGEV
jgi:hypothetical protein